MNAKVLVIPVSGTGADDVQYVYFIEATSLLIAVIGTELQARYGFQLREEDEVFGEIELPSHVYRAAVAYAEAHERLQTTEDVLDTIRQDTLGRHPLETAISLRHGHDVPVPLLNEWTRSPTDGSPIRRRIHLEEIDTWGAAAMQALRASIKPKKPHARKPSLWQLLKWAWQDLVQT